MKVLVYLITLGATRQRPLHVHDIHAVRAMSPGEENHKRGFGVSTHDRHGKNTVYSPKMST